MKNFRIEEHVCTLCPVHCTLSIEQSASDGQIKNIYGIRCSRGYEYINQSYKEQQCMLPTSVRVHSDVQNRLPVNSDAPLPKTAVSEAMMIIRTVEVMPPVNAGEIIIENILNTGVNIISTKSVLI